MVYSDCIYYINRVGGGGALLMGCLSISAHVYYLTHPQNLGRAMDPFAPYFKHPRTTNSNLMPEYLFSTFQILLNFLHMLMMIMNTRSLAVSEAIIYFALLVA